MLSKVEEEQHIKLEQLNSIKAQQNSLFNSIKTSPSADCLSNLTNISSPVVTNNSNTTALSLEEKERLSKQSEQNERLRTQSPLIPQTAKPLQEQSKPKDLTSTLINSNLSHLSLNSNSRQMPANNMGFSQSFTSPPLNNQLNAFPFQSQMQTNSVQYPSSGFPSMSAPIGQQTIRPNLSAFDNIVIPDLKTSTTSQPMRTMNANTTPFLNNSTNMAFNQQNSQTFGPFVDSNSSGKQAKQLSRSELEDFLS